MTKEHSPIRQDPLPEIREAWWKDKRLALKEKAGQQPDNPNTDATKLPDGGKNAEAVAKYPKWIMQAIDRLPYHLSSLEASSTTQTSQWPLQSEELQPINIPPEATSDLDELFKGTEVNPAINVGIVTLEEKEIRGKPIDIIAVKLGKGAELKPHLHGDGDEAAFSPTGIEEGQGHKVILGKPDKNEDGTYKMVDGKAVVNWGQPLKPEPGKPFSLAPAEAHYIKADMDNPYYVFFAIPPSHYKEIPGKQKDIVFTTHPSEQKVSKPSGGVVFDQSLLYAQ